MHKLVIIDDEYEHVHGIANYIDWAKYDIEVCGVAYNGKEGLEVIKNTHPDIALVDIQMPHIDGLDLTEKIKEMGMNVQVIIVSGYDYFEYTKKAIELKASNYLLKPCSAEEIIQAVMRAKNAVIEEQNRKQMISEYQDLFNQYKNLLRSQFLSRLLDNKLRNRSTFFNECSKYEINLTETPCCTAIIRIEDKHELYTKLSNEEFDFVLLQITETIKGMEGPGLPFEIVMKNDDIVIISSHKELETTSFKEFIIQIFDELTYNYDYNFIAGIGKIAPSPLQSHKSYREALAALESCIFLSDKKIAVFDDQMSEENILHLYPSQDEEKIFEAIETGDFALAEKSVTGFFENFEHVNIRDSYYIKKIGVLLLNNITNFCTRKNIDSQNLQTLILKSYDEITETKDLKTLSLKIANIVENIIKEIHDDAPLNRFIQKALDYIHKNYHKNISLKTMAEELYISPAYLSFLFKQEMKTNLIDYLNSYRIEMAKELLKDVHLKNYEVAYKVGFQDEKYFCKIFKKYTGLTASQYRDSLRIKR
ncbi:MAG: response regulator [Clostridiaceae bacterium]|nr:response regulator [Clostridiaceae bacterium]